jgi:hypothetical protein
MAVFQGQSGEAEDRIVNTFHFVGPDAYEDMVDPCILRVQDFYNGANTNNTLSGYMSRWLNFGAEVRTYDLEIPKNTRVPTIQAFDRSFATNDVGLPEEVAVCLTIRGATPPAISRRRRGRLYFGPLNSTALIGGNATGPSRPHGNLITDLTVAALRMINDSGSGGAWCIHSTVPAENFVPVAGGYVDNAFDTQRRRGPDPTTKLEFSAVLP